MKPVQQSRSLRARALLAVGLVALFAIVAAACGENGSNDAATGAPPTTPSESIEAESLAGTTLRVLTHDSFNVSDEVIQAFEQQTGITVDLVKGGDAVEVVNQAILTRDNPQGDVLFGIDNNLLSRANDANLFEPYESPGLATVDAQYQLDPDHRVTPIDRGDVCLNFDREYFTSHQLAVPQSLEDLTKPEYKGLLVVENPSTSTPGLAFLLATVAQFGPDGWQDYWQQLKANDVTVSEGWEQAYYDLFSGGSGGGVEPARGQLRLEPSGRGAGPVDARRRVADGRDFRQLLSADRVRRRVGRYRPRGRGAGVHRLPVVGARSRTTCR